MVDDVRSVLRDQAFEALIEEADKGASLMRSLSEAAYRGDSLTAEAHIRQLRAIVVFLIQTYKDYLSGQAARSSRPHSQDQRSGDDVARRQLE